MNTDIASQIAQQRLALDALRADGPDMANLLAAEVWDRFEVEVEEATEDGILFEYMDSIGIALCAGLVDAFDKAFDRHVLNRCTQINGQLSQLMGKDVMDTSCIELTGLRKSLKLRRHAQPLIEAAVERARPGFGRALDVIVGDIFNDPIKQLDSIEAHMQQDAKNLRRELIVLREPLRTHIAEESLSAIQFTRLELTRQLEEDMNSATTAAPEKN